MSELIKTHDNRATIRWKLLTGASALALTAYVSSAGMAKAEDASRPLIWIELDGQFAQQKNDLEIYSPPFLAASPFDAVSHLGLEKSTAERSGTRARRLRSSRGKRLDSFARIRYGKTAQNAKSSNHIDASTPIVTLSALDDAYNAYQDSRRQSSESHTIVDFQAGKDVGLGRFGSDASSVVSLGVRYCAVQFEQSRRTFSLSRRTARRLLSLQQVLCVL